MTDTEKEEQPDLKKLSLATLIGVSVLGAVVYGAYAYSQRNGANIALPGGTTYLGEPTPGNQPPTAPLRFTADPNVSWTTYSGKLYPYSFSYPTTLILNFFPGDKNDPVAIVWGNIPAQYNILLNIENIRDRDASYVNKPKIDYINNWYKYFGGLKGVTKVETFTNTGGLKGYKASYTNTAGSSPNLDVFFEIPGRNDILLHLANGVLDPDIFNRLVDSVEWNAPTPTTSPTQ